jgi:hypothetical protein
MFEFQVRQDSTRLYGSSTGPRAMVESGIVYGYV